MEYIYKDLSILVVRGISHVWALDPSFSAFSFSVFVLFCPAFGSFSDKMPLVDLEISFSGASSSLILYLRILLAGLFDFPLKKFLLTFILCVRAIVSISGQLQELTPCGFRGLNSGCQAWQQLCPSLLSYLTGLRMCRFTTILSFEDGFRPEAK